MNAVFTAIMLAASAVLLILQPSAFLPALTEGAKKGLDTAVTLLLIYAIWMGFAAVAEESRLTERIATLLGAPVKRLFRTKNAGAVRDIAMNVSCNLLGIGGAATPYAVRAIGALECEGNTFAQNMLFIINATSVQLLPTTVISLRATMGSAAAYDIVLPSLIATCLSTGIAVALYLALDRVKAARRAR